MLESCHTVWWVASCGRDVLHKSGAHLCEIAPRCSVLACSTRHGRCQAHHVHSVRWLGQQGFKICSAIPHLQMESHASHHNMQLPGLAHLQPGRHQQQRQRDGDAQRGVDQRRDGFQCGVAADRHDREAQLQWRNHCIWMQLWRASWWFLGGVQLTGLQAAQAACLNAHLADTLDWHEEEPGT